MQTAADHPLAPPPATNLHRAHVQLAWAMLVINILAILFCGMFPFNFGAQLGTYAETFRRRFMWDLNNPPDVAENVVFFIPFGFALGAIAGRRFFKSWPRWFASLVVATLCGFAMTCLIEGSQVMLASRDSCESDLACNTSGAIIGFILYRILGEPVMRAISRPYAALRRAIDWHGFAAAATVWFAAAAVAPYVAGNASSLDNWFTTYHLCLGGEADGARKFNGRVGNVFMADAAVTDAQAERLFTNADFPATIGPGHVVAAYRPHGWGPYPDASGTLSPLSWVGGPPALMLPNHTPPRAGAPPWANAFNGIPVSTDHWLRTAGDTASAVKKIYDSQAFTLMVDYASDDIWQSGPARIVTISANPGARNLTVGEDQPYLIIRINTPTTGGNGTDPEFQINDAFPDNSPHRLIIAYQRPTLRIYLDSMNRRFITTLLPETNLVNRLYPRQWRYPIGTNGRELIAYVYRLLVFAPLGILIAGATALLPRRRLAAAAIALLAAVLLDAELQHFALDGFNTHRLAAAIILCAGIAAIAPPIRAWTNPA